MIGRGLRPLKREGAVKNDCLVLDFGFSLATHGDIRQRVWLQQRTCPNCGTFLDLGQTKCPECHWTAEKLCPKCSEHMTSAQTKCSRCGYEEDIPTKKSNSILEPGNKPRTLSEFDMVHVDVLNSNFEWYEFEDGHMLASGIGSWAAIFQHNNTWFAVSYFGKEVKFVCQGAHSVCLAAASDFMNLHESESTVRATKKWHTLPATAKQLKYLREFRRPLTRYEASVFLTLKFNSRLIEGEISRASNKPFSMQQLLAALPTKTPVSRQLDKNSTNTSAQSTANKPVDANDAQVRRIAELLKATKTSGEIRQV